MQTAAVSSYRHLDITPLSGSIGAEVRGVDLSTEISDVVLAEISNAFHAHLVVCFPSQTLTPAQLAAFAERFGPLFHHPHVKALNGHPAIQEVCKEPNTQGYNFGVTWHTDGSFLTTPARATLLHAQELPPIGGDTEFSNMYRAFESLSPAMRQLLQRLKAHHSGGNTYGPWGGRKRKLSLGGATPDDESEHPVIGTHPITKKKFLYVNRVFTTNFCGMSIEESASLLEYLTDHVARPEFTCRVRWTPNMLVMWDNLATQHCAIDDYQGYRRFLHRAVVLGSEAS